VPIETLVAHDVPMQTNGTSRPASHVESRRVSLQVWSAGLLPLPSVPVRDSSSRAVGGVANQRESPTGSRTTTALRSWRVAESIRARLAKSLASAWGQAELHPGG
ncbi:MAG: hypothetical protein KDA60_15080, partial [Planctomycetales bacterium]|nr:hypothetical protein [Planctomycetales bacterium]